MTTLLGEARNLPRTLVTTERPVPVYRRQLFESPSSETFEKISTQDPVVDCQETHRRGCTQAMSCRCIIVTLKKFLLSSADNMA